MAERSLNRVELIGRLGRDAETAYTANNRAVTKFSVATERRWKDSQSGEWKSATNWTNVAAWQQEGLAQYLVKGARLFLSGYLQTRDYKNKDDVKVYVTEVIAEDIILLSSAKGSEEQMRDQMDNQGLKSQPRAQQARAAAPANPPAARQQEGGWDGDPDVPF